MSYASKKQVSPKSLIVKRKFRWVDGVSLKVSFLVNSGRRKEVSGDGGALGVYKVRLKVDR